MIAQTDPQHSENKRWMWPDPTLYDQSSELRETEYQALDVLIRRIDSGLTYWPSNTHLAIQRLLAPLQDMLQRTQAQKQVYHSTILVCLREMHLRQSSLWAWTPQEWIDVLDRSGKAFAQRYKGRVGCRQHIIAIGYLLCGLTEFHLLGHVDKYALACKIFGPSLIDDALQRIQEAFLSLHYKLTHREEDLPGIVSVVLLVNRSPYLEDLTLDRLQVIRQGPFARSLTKSIFCLSRALKYLGILPQVLPNAIHEGERYGNADNLAGIASEWLSWCQRWRGTSPLSESLREHVYYDLLKIGRWLTATHPDVIVPQHWTRELAAEFVAAVNAMCVGQWSTTRRLPAERLGKPLSPRTKGHLLGSLRIFLSDIEEWGWIERRFDPSRYLATPRTVRALIGPDPRVIQDDSWAKLLWAGLNLSAEDLPRPHSRNGLQADVGAPFYPLEMVKAMVIVWLFSGLRRSEFRRLRVGCIRWQREEIAVHETGETITENAICWLQVPVHKTGTAFTKGVDHIVGEAISAWEQVRPPQPSHVDQKTGEIVNYLFSYRGGQVGNGYLNRSLIPLLCRKGGVPLKDARGNITSHRARSTIASQLFNAKEPMSLFELQEWLGHRWASSTQSYAKLKPTKVAKSYEKAGYFARNIRAIEVLIDQEVIRNGAAADGVPWRYFDLGHGYCTYDFFDQCPHRMACAKCSFYLPKGSSRAQLLEAKAHLLHMKQEIPLSQEEIAAVDEGLAALDKLCEKLMDTPTPEGPTPRELKQGETFIPLHSLQRQTVSTDQF